MTPKQKQNYNKMLHTLKVIVNSYQTPEQIRRNSFKQWGCDYEEALEMSYENIQGEAKWASKGIREIK